MTHSILPFYNVTSAVGKGKGNRTDVMLVQYMLFKVCINPRPHFAKSFNFGPTAPPGIIGGAEAIFPHTGTYSTELDKWIANFQSTANQRGYGPLTVDGVVSPAPVGWGRQSIGRTNRWYTMQALNVLMLEKSERPYSQLPDLDDVPAELGGELKLFALNDFLKV